MCCCVLCILYYTEKVEIHSDFLNLNLAPPQDRKEKKNPTIAIASSRASPASSPKLDKPRLHYMRQSLFHRCSTLKPSQHAEKRSSQLCASVSTSQRVTLDSSVKFVVKIQSGFREGYPIRNRFCNQFEHVRRIFSQVSFEC